MNSNQAVGGIVASVHARATTYNHLFIIGQVGGAVHVHACPAFCLPGCSLLEARCISDSFNVLIRWLPIIRYVVGRGSGKQGPAWWRGRSVSLDCVKGMRV